MRAIMFILKSFVGLMAAIGFLIVAAIVLLTVFAKEAADKAAQPELPGSFILALDLRDGPFEQNPNPFSFAGLSSQFDLLTFHLTMERAAQDEAVKGLFFHAGRGQLSPSMAQEVAAAFSLFQRSGKPLYAFSESFEGGGSATIHYSLASYAEELWMQPSGQVAYDGLRLEGLFLRDLLDEWDIEPEYSQREAYKGAAENLLNSRFSPPVRQNLTALLNNIMQQSIDVVAVNRGLDPVAVRSLLDRPALSAAEAKASGLIDELGYEDEVRAALEAMSGAQDYLDFKTYSRALKLYEENDGEIALITVQGPILLQDGGGFSDHAEATAERLVPLLEEASRDEGVRAIVLRIDSPGGSYVAADSIWRQVQLLAASGKPVVVSFGATAASGGYFIAAPATRIIANPASVTGSIGVVSGKIVVRDFLKRVDLSSDAISIGRNSGYWSATETFRPDQRQHLESTMDRVYEDFLFKVASGRGLSPEETRGLAGGRVYSGQQAVEAGLVDQLGGLTDAIDLARAEAALPPDAGVQRYPSREKALEKFFTRMMRGGVETQARLMRLEGWMASFDRLLSRSGLEQLGGAEISGAELRRNVEFAD